MVSFINNSIAEPAVSVSCVTDPQICLSISSEATAVFGSQVGCLLKPGTQTPGRECGENVIRRPEVHISLSREICSEKAFLASFFGDLRSCSDRPGISGSDDSCTRWRQSFNKVFLTSGSQISGIQCSIPLPGPQYRQTKFIAVDLSLGFSARGGLSPSLV